jgi:hypothetical protein
MTNREDRPRDDDPARQVAALHAQVLQACNDAEHLLERTGRTIDEHSALIRTTGARIAASRALLARLRPVYRP